MVGEGSMGKWLVLSMRARPADGFRFPVLKRYAALVVR
jgi:hypothetical protein